MTRWRAGVVFAFAVLAATSAGAGTDYPQTRRVDPDAGHYPAGIDANLDLWSDQLAFLVRALDLDTSALEAAP